MHKQITREDIEAIQALTQMMGANGQIIRIAPVRVCDHCLDEEAEAFPYYDTDPTGRLWDHLCWDCYDKLGCGNK